MAKATDILRLEKKDYTYLLKLLKREKLTPKVIELMGKLQMLKGNVT